MKTDVFLIDAEDSELCLSCCLKSLRMTVSDMARGLIQMERSGVPGAGYLLDCCDAMFPALQMLDHLRENIWASINGDSSKQEDRTEGPAL